MTDASYDYDDEESEAKGRDHLFLWSIFILLLIGLALGCWLGSFYVFGHPEQPRPYHLLKKLHKIDPPKRFEITAAPQGEYLSPQKLFDRFSKYAPLRLEEANAKLLRDFIKNYRETKDRVPYVTGRFEIIQSYELRPTDLFSTGMVALASAVENPRVVIEHVYPTSPENVGKLRALLQTGLELKIEKTFDVAAIIHAARIGDGRFLFTVVPLSYGNYALKQGIGTFSLEPPMELNVAANAPIIRGKTFMDAMRSYAEFRRSKPALEDAEESGKSNEPELVRLDTMKPGSQVPESGAFPEAPVATPMPMSTPRLAAHTPAGGGKLAFNTAPPAPRATATPIPVARAVLAAPATPAAGLPPTVKLKPFIASVPERAGLPPTGGNWRVYPAGRQPAGRQITASDAATLADRSDIAEPVYLRGSFVVSASGDNWAVLRPQANGPASAKETADTVRVIVQYPATATPPPEGATFSRDASRGFKVDGVRRGADGQLNVTVREVTQAL